MKMRGIKYWGKIWGETEGIILLVTLFLYLFTGMDFEFLGKGGVTESIFSLLAWYLVIAGAFVTFVITVSCFQQYLPMAVAFGATRKNAAAGALLLGPASCAVTLAAAALLWILAGDDVARAGLHLLGALAGGLLAVNGIGVLFGVAVLRFKRAAFVLMFMGLLVGAGGGIAWSILVGGKLEGRVTDLAQSLVRTGNPAAGLMFAAAGAGIYLLCSLLALGLTRKIEVRL